MGGGRANSVAIFKMRADNLRIETYREKTVKAFIVNTNSYHSIHGLEGFVHSILDKLSGIQITTRINGDV